MVKVVSERLLTLPQVAEILAKEAEKRELSSVEAVTLEYARKFSKVDSEGAEKLFEELVELGLPGEIAAQIVNVMPRTEDEVRVLLAPLSRGFTGEEVKTILDRVNAYRRKS
ncbi:MAG: hypothetical protein DRJ57_00410 [Thermoprotei archaeon]|nr:MAG: hypothetical protein DRJ57_00410 [Thermoprotei archaeon]